jgi:hypothetical protein
MAPFSMAFCASLLSIVVWLQDIWGWSALKTQLTIAPGPLLRPTTALLASRPLIERLGTAAAVALVLSQFVVGGLWWHSSRDLS